MSKPLFPRLRVGARLSEDTTVLGIVDRNRGRHPVYIVWSHAAWCPMACKTFDDAERARDELNILNLCAHPNIVRAWGVADRPPHLLLEFLEGASVESKIVSGKALPIADSLRLAIHVGGALQFMHSRGYVHLDLKPANIMIVKDRPVLFDFGCARRIGGPRPSRVQGTDPYIAPEECELGAVSAATDVFSFAVSLFEMLASRLPFNEPTRKIPFPQLTQKPVRLRAFRPTASLALERLLLACLTREPDRRPPLQEILVELNRLIPSGPRMWPESFAPGTSSAAEKSKAA